MVTHAHPLTASGSFAAPGAAAAAFRRWARRVWTALELVGARRARRDLESLAARTADPVLAAELRRVLAEDWLARG